MKLAEFKFLLDDRAALLEARVTAESIGNNALVAMLDAKLAEYQTQIDAALAEAAKEEK